LKSPKQQPNAWTICKAVSEFKFEIVYAVGGGLVTFSAVYISVKLILPLVVLPTALSVDAFMTAASGIRKN